MDALIQKGLRKSLCTDTTIITIAHRLRTIMDADKIVSRSRCDFKLADTDEICRWCWMLAEWCAVTLKTDLGLANRHVGRV